MSLIENLNKAFESRVRLGIMAGLLVEEGLDFNALKTLLDVTDGNLASHLRALEEAGYIATQKSFIGRKSNTSYSITPNGRTAFQAHLKGLEKLLGQ
jgi:DNA-binding MarR family transcriptional regulator